MKLAEALIERADLQKKLAEMSNRVVGNLVVQGDDEPFEDPNELFAEYADKTERLSFLIRSINLTNVNSDYNEHMTIAGALAERDVVGMKIKFYQQVIAHAGYNRRNRFSVEELKDRVTVDLKEVRNYLDRLSQQYRDMDTRIQSLNWSTELIEA